MISFKTTEKIQSVEEIAQQTERLSDSVKRLLKNYFRQLGGEDPKDVYEMVLSEVEMPLLEFLLGHTKNNQVKTTRLLGLSRGTVRQKLKKYGML
ncbi:MAG: factor for inversion stimulation Fis, transcriptional activator [Gammaproteobacteria bacterium]|jgi:Fis family transcriptional regulator|nr:factor for inversion stimulation Fis, transcriptional activator [Gammaproteobacteria bacterium]